MTVKESVLLENQTCDILDKLESAGLIKNSEFDTLWADAEHLAKAILQLKGGQERREQLDTAIE